MNLTHTHEFLITHITDSGTGFGVRTDNGESVHISPRLLQQAHANLDDICTGIIVQNAVEDQRERTPWVAAYVQERRAARDVLGLATDAPAEAVQAWGPRSLSRLIGLTSSARSLRCSRATR
jgi:hypothetical protein